MTTVWDENGVLAFWSAPVSESPEWIAERADAFATAATATTGITSWRLSDSTVWEGTLAEKADLVRRFPDAGATGEPEPEDGYVFSLSGTTTDHIFIEAMIMAGDPCPGTPVPGHTVSVMIQKLAEHAQDPGIGLSLLQDAVVAFAPATATWSVDGMYDARRRKPWQVVDGNATWINDHIGTITALADGITAERIGSGTLLTAPADWTDEHISTAICTTLDLNQINEVPH